MTGVSERSQHISNLKYEGYIKNPTNFALLQGGNSEHLPSHIDSYVTGVSEGSQRSNSVKGVRSF
nr:hypothetical protein [Salmonella bongori serovar 66:z65:-]